MNIRFTTVQRRLLSRTFIYGAILTTAVLVFEWFNVFGLLGQFERFIYDRRARVCQTFSPPPSKELVHFHIDEQTLQEIGRWPWPRSRLALIVDELHQAKAKVIALDVMLAEPDLPALQRQADGSVVEANNDLLMADAMRRAGNVLAPTSAVFMDDATRPIRSALARRLDDDLEQDSSKLEELLVADGHTRGAVEQAVQGEFLEVQKELMIRRLEDMARDGPLPPMDEVVARLTPRAVQAGLRSDARLAAEAAYRRMDAILRVERFALGRAGENLPARSEVGPQAPRALAGKVSSGGVPGADPEPAAQRRLRLLRANTPMMQVPVPPIADAAAFSGYVDHVPSDDAVVRAVPLVSNYRGRLFPHMVLATACAALDVPIESVRVEPGKVVLPLKDGPPIEIPTHVLSSQKFGAVGGFAYIPWFGLRDPWWSMYDTPRFERPVQQYSLADVWRIEQLREQIARNKDRSIEPLMYLSVSVLGQGEQESLRRFRQMPPEQWEEAVAALADDKEMIGPAYDQLRAMKPEELSEEEKRLVAAVEALRLMRQNNQWFRTRIDEARERVRQRVEGKTVLVGWAAAGLMDYYPTSLHAQCPGVVIQGVAINSILTRHFLRAVPEWVAPLITLACGAAVTLFVAFFSSYRALVATLALVAAYVAVNGVVLYDYFDLIVPAAGAITASGAVWGALTLYRYIFESAERTRITKRFSSYVDPAIVNYYIDDPDRVRLDGDAREMTVVFTDLAGFTTISEKLQERTVPLLNDYMSRMMPVIRRNRGRWNKFLGDGIMFFYNAPDPNPAHARDAVVTVLEMQKEVEIFNQALLAQQLPKVAMRAGIVTGRMIAGDAGSIGVPDDPNNASDYTVLGDNVNLAARLESANKALGSRTLVVERTVELMGPGLLVRPIARLQVVGKTQGVLTYEPIAFEAEATDAQRKLAEHSKRVVDLFTARQFEACIKAVEAMQEELGSSKFTALYLSQAREYLLGPPEEDWDGTIVLEAK